jgi:hypothetical protein
VVSIGKQQVSVFDADGRLTGAPISSGRVGFPTPTGVFSVVQKKRIHYSNLYESAPMPNMQRITWSGVAMHAGVLPGYPASHGCIRLPHSFSNKLYGLTQLGTRVIVTRDPVEPVSFTHPDLFVALPPVGDPAAPAAANPGQATEASPTLRPTEVAQATTSDAGLPTTQVAEVIGVSPVAAAGTESRLERLKAVAERLHAAKVAEKARIE